MSTELSESEASAAAPVRNEVLLAGRVSAAPSERELPSGDRVVTFRLVLPGAGPP